MNILVVNYEYPPIGGGGGVISKDISEEIALMGHNVTVVTSHFGDLPQKEILNNVEIIRVPVVFRNKQNTASLLSMLSYVPSSIFEVEKIFKQKNFDVINTHFAVPSGPAGYYMSKRFNIPNVLSIHGGDIYDPSKSLSPHKTFGLKQTVKKMLETADKVVAQSSNTKNNAIDFYGVNREIEIVPLGIKQSVYKEKSRKELSLPENKFLLVTVGRLVKRKNLEQLLEIFSEILKEKDAELLVIGDGPEKENLISKSRELKIENSVKMLGRVSDEEKFQYLAASDIYVSTAMHEGFGIVFLEAMECGLPVICYNNGGQVDFLKNEQTGYLIQLNEKNIFKEKLISLLNNQKLRENIFSFNKDYVKNFYIRSIAKQYLEIFNGVLGNYPSLNNEKRYKQAY